MSAGWIFRAIVALPSSMCSAASSTQERVVFFEAPDRHRAGSHLSALLATLWNVSTNGWLEDGYIYNIQCERDLLGGGLGEGDSRLFETGSGGPQPIHYAKLADVDLFVSPATRARLDKARREVPETSELAASAIAARTATLTPPALGQLWPGQGGVYLGICRGEAGQPALHLIMATTAESKLKSVWGEQGKDVPGAKQRFDGRANTQAMAAAGSAIAQQVLALESDGHADYFIGSQAQLQLACANAPEQFEAGYHWSSTQHSRYYAFVQDFESGLSSWGIKVGEHRVRAFRGLTLEPLNTLARSAA